jgi:hypothetical protein
MEQSPKICPKCRQANFPIAEFCRHCGEPIFAGGSLSRTSFFTRGIGHFVDGLFWIIDEFVRWWEIARLGVTSKRLRKQRSDLLGRQSTSEADFPSESREKLVHLSEEISRLNTREDFLRRKSWAMTPEFVLIGIVGLFLAGIFWIRPNTEALPATALPGPSFISGQARKAGDFSLQGFSTITSAVWHEGKLLVGGDGGVTMIDPGTGRVASIGGLPDGFFVRDLAAEGSSLLIAGLGGVYASTAIDLSPLYPPERLPVSFLNKVVPVRDGHLLGTIGGGLLKARRDFAVVVLDTAGLTINGMAWLEDELWLLHERGLMFGDGTSFKRLDIPIVAGKRLTAIAAVAGTLYLGTNQGILSALRTNQSWIWAPMGAGAPISSEDMLVASDTLLVCASDGVFRLQPGRDFERIIADSGMKKLALSGNILAVISPTRVVFYQFDVPVGFPQTPVNVLPQVGSFVYATPGSPALAPINSPVPIVSAPSVAPAAQPPIIANPLPPSVVNNSTLLGSEIPEALRGPYIKAAQWDGTRLFLGTSNSGLWILADGQWKNLSQENGKLRDNQITSIFSLRNQIFIYGWMIGLMRVQGDALTTVLSPEQARNLMNLSGDPGSPYVLFRNGKVAQLSGSTLRDKLDVPPDLRKGLRQVEFVGGIPHLLTDFGVAVPAGNDWFLHRFDDSLGGTVTQSFLSQDRISFIRSNGGVFQFSGGRLEKLADLSGAPFGLSLSGNALFAADSQSIYRIQEKTLTPVGRYAAAPTVGNLLVLAERRAAVFFTDRGPEIIDLNL